MGSLSAWRAALSAGGRRALLGARPISTSGKRSDTSTVTAPPTAATPSTVATPSSTLTTVTDKNWVSYGFSHRDRLEDEQIHNVIFFFFVSVLLVSGGVVLAYRPDFHYKDWASREGYLELRRREQLGLPLIDRNFVDPQTFTLPSDEELGDTDIII